MERVVAITQEPAAADNTAVLVQSMAHLPGWDEKNFQASVSAYVPAGHTCALLLGCADPLPQRGVLLATAPAQLVPCESQCWDHPTGWLAVLASRACQCCKLVAFTVRGSCSAWPLSSVLLSLWCAGHGQAV
jgi:hypothetical protein